MAALVAVSCGGSAAWYVQTGDRNFKAGRYAEAAINYRKAIQIDAKQGEAYYGLGRADIEKRDYQEAFTVLTQASDLLPRRLDVKAKLADLVLGLYESDPSDANLYGTLTKLTGQMLAIDPASFDGLRMKGNLALLDRKPEQAIAAFERANQIQPMQERLIMGYAQALIQVGRGPEAEKLAHQLIERRKDFGPIYDVLFQYYVSKGDAAAGEKILRDKIANNPSDSGPYIQLAAYYRQAQKPAEMQAALDELLQSYATRKDAYLLTGDFYARYREWDKAVAIYQKGGQIQPDQSATFGKRTAGVRIAQGRPAEAIEILDQVLGKHPTDQDAEIARADLLMQRGRPGDLDKAISEFQLVLDAHPGYEAALVSLGKAFMAKHDFAAASRTLKRASQFAPQAEEPRTLLATIDISDGKPAEASVILDDVLRDSPGSVRARYLKINALIMQGKYDEARPELDKLSREFPQSNDLNLLRGLLSIFAKRFNDAESIFSRVGMGGSDPRFTGGLAEVYASQQEFDKALQVLEAEARKAPDQLLLRRMIAKTAIRAGQYDRAIVELQGLLKKQPDSVMAMTDLGQAYQAKGDLADAEKQFQQAIHVSSKDPVPYFYLAYTLNASGKHAEAMQSYRQALALRPNDSLAMNNLAYTLANDGSPKDLDDALQLVRRALEISPHESDFQDTLAWVWLKKGESDQAVQIFTELCKEKPSNPSYRHHLGLALLAHGDNAAAQKTFELALASGPTQGEAIEIKAEMARAASRR